MRTLRRERGFTMVEVLIALTILTIGMIGVVAMQGGAFGAASYSRRATEAAILAEDKLEELRTVPIATAESDSDVVDATGVPTDEGPFTRVWTLDVSGTLVTLTVTVTWQETDGAHAITFRTLRNLD